MKQHQTVSIKKMWLIRVNLGRIEWKRFGLPTLIGSAHRDLSTWFILLHASTFSFSINIPSRCCTLPLTIANPPHLAYLSPYSPRSIFLGFSFCCGSQYLSSWCWRYALSRNTRRSLDKKIDCFCDRFRINIGRNGSNMDWSPAIVKARQLEPSSAYDFLCDIRSLYVDSWGLFDDCQWDTPDI